MKTIQKHFESIEDKELREIALKYTDEKTLNDKRETVSKSLLSGFEWESTKEGFHYWDKQYGKFIKQGK